LGRGLRGKVPQVIAWIKEVKAIAKELAAKPSNDNE